MDRLTTAQAADTAGVKLSRIRAFIADGRLPATKAGRDWLIDPADVDCVERRPPGNRSGKPRGPQAHQPR